MATKNPRILITFPDNLDAKIEDYRFTARGKTHAAAVRSLVELGLEVAMKELETPEGLERLRRRLEAADYRNFDSEQKEQK